MGQRTIHISTIRGQIQNNYSAAVAPTASDGLGNGYTVGSIWIDTLLNKSYTCVDDSIGTSVWEAHGSSGGSSAELKSFSVAMAIALG